MKTVYENAGVPTRAFVPEADQTYPAFEAVQHELAEDKDNQALLGRMSPIFDLELFSSGAQVTDFASVAEQSTVIRLAQLPGDEVKNSVAEFFLMALYNYLIRQPQAHKLARLAVLDEAWRLVQSPFLEPLMREGRAFGLGVVDRVAVPDRPADAGRRLDGDQALLLTDQRRADPRHPTNDPRQDIGCRRRPPRQHHARPAPADVRAVQQAVPALCPRRDQPVLPTPAVAGLPTRTPVQPKWAS